MDFYDDQNNVQAYIKMADGYDGRELIDKLRMHLPTGSSVLELGMGPGKDLDILQESFQVTGSDRSQIFLDLYREEHPDADLMLLDAALLNTGRTFDCIYSNKVLHHLSRAELLQSWQRQYSLLNDGGLLCHSFWYGTEDQVVNGVQYSYYTEQYMELMAGMLYKVVLLEQATEDEAGDTLYVILQK